MPLTAPSLLSRATRQWKWSSFRAYFYGEPGPVRVNFQEWSLEVKPRPVEKFGDERRARHPAGPSVVIRDADKDYL
jgi:hypothetical protein